MFDGCYNRFDVGPLSILVDDCLVVKIHCEIVAGESTGTSASAGVAT